MNTITKPKANLRTACKERLMKVLGVRGINSTSKERSDAIYSAMMNKGVRNTKQFAEKDVDDIVELAMEIYFA